MEYGLIGEKLGHSYSKIIHERIADYEYDLRPLSKSEFKTFMDERPFQAINVTIPYKEAVIPFLDEMDDKARAIGAVNAIVKRDGKLIGYNTDFDGFHYMIKKHDVQVKGRKAIILGNGGASKAVLAVLRQLQASEILLVDVAESESAITYETCRLHHTDANLIVNTSPIGMYPKTDASPFDGTPLDLSQFHNCDTVLDVIYNPLETKLTKQAKELGMTAETGLEMLVAQAVYAVEIFKGKPFTIDKSIIDTVYHELKKALTEKRNAPSSAEQI